MITRSPPISPSGPTVATVRIRRSGADALDLDEIVHRRVKLAAHRRLRGVAGAESQRLESPQGLLGRIGVNCRQRPAVSGVERPHQIQSLRAPWQTSPVLSASNSS